MTVKKSLIRLSAFLLFFNLLLGVFAVFTFLKANHKQSQTEARQEAQVLSANAVPMFNRNQVLTDNDFTSTRAFPDEASIQRYLDQINSPLRNYTDQGRRASYWIFAAARGQTSSRWGIVPQLNPGVILAYLQKEQSLLTMVGYDTVRDPEFRLRAAMGYGCPDDAACNPIYSGFANQVNWAAYQLQLNFTQASTGGGGTPYKINHTITTLDEYRVFITNAATAANYRYTPHVYWGNYNLWKIITANGWGQNSQTYDMAAIDRVNLPLREQRTPADPNEKPITLAEVYPLLTREYTLGETSEQIRLLQTFLRQQGYFVSGDITGTFGVVTRSALIAYRRNQGIIVGQPSSGCRELVTRDYIFGTTSEEIRQLQQCLRDMGLFDFPTNTGYYGPITQDAQTKARKAIANLAGNTTTSARCLELKNATWQFGERSSRVVELQDCMRAAGTFNWPYGSTGFFGEVTRQALEAWRARDAANSPSAPSHPNPDPASTPTPIGKSCSDMKKRGWVMGDRSEDVRILQDCMRADGKFHWPYGSTGFFGEVTRAAFLRWRNQGNTCQELKDSGWILGERGSHVVRLQDCMRADGKFNWPHGSTGFFGEVTRQALIDWRGYF